MSARNSASTRICPVCNAPNSNLSLVCAECGSSLNAPESDDTAAFKPIASDEVDAQRTAAFEPTPVTREATPSRADDESSSDGYRTSWQAPAATFTEPAPYTPVWNAPAAPVVAGPRSIRGFVLGMVAALLILAIFLLWTWASLLDQGTRDSIRDFFGFVG